MTTGKKTLVGSSSSSADSIPGIDEEDDAIESDPHTVIPHQAAVKMVLQLKMFS